jgi:hypothetical protein
MKRKEDDAMAKELSNWRKGCTPHRDIREDRVSEVLFAVNLSRAIAREGADEYRDPARFFEYTLLTRTLQGLIRDVLGTLGSQPGAVAALGLLDTVGRCVSEGRFGYAATTAALVQAGAQPVDLDGYVGQPELPPPDARLIRLHGTITPMQMANVMKTAINLSKLSAESSITLDLKLELKGDVNDHSVQMALREIQRLVPGLAVEDVKGGS